MRVHLTNDRAAENFSRTLLSIGNGTYPSDGTQNILLEDNFCRLVANREDLIERVFPNLLFNLSNKEWLCQRAILATKNDAVDEINFIIQERVNNRPQKTYLSIDEVIDPDQAVNYPVEF